MTEQNTQVKIQKPLPVWFRQALPSLDKLQSMQHLLEQASLNTVCQGARCPNLGQCWGGGVATFMILGSCCTRRCRFCAVDSGIPFALDDDEPRRVAEAVLKLQLKYVVITSVTRDDLLDQGSEQFVRVVEMIRKASPEVRVELLIPDFSGREDLLKVVMSSGAQVIGHNLEMVRRLFPAIRSLARYDCSLNVLRKIKQEVKENQFVKSGFMVGLGEEEKEIFELIDDLAEVGCNIITIGQYLSPGQKDRHVVVERFYTPEDFKRFEDYAKERGIGVVLSGPLVRSSYNAEASYCKLIAINQRREVVCHRKVRT